MPVVDLAFPVLGQEVPVDHGYALYASICHQQPGLHRTGWLGVHPLNGRPNGDGCLLLPRRTALRFRLPLEKIGELLPLAGSSLLLHGKPLSLGVPSVFPLLPSTSLDSRLVVIKLTREPKKTSAVDARETLDVSAFAQRYLMELTRQLQHMQVRGQVQLCGRQRMTVGGRRIVGYSVRVHGLSDADSIRLQERGLGGKRAMGCGLFRATSDRSTRQ